MKDGLTYEQSATLETTSIKNLIRDGLDALYSLHFASTGADALFTLTSIGVEKLMKVSLGLFDLRETRCT